MKIKRILVPIDFSPTSLRALEFAADLARPFGAELLVLHVVEPVYYVAPDYGGAQSAAMLEVLEEQRRSGRAGLARLERRYAKRRIALRTLLQTGRPAHVIEETARESRVDLIAMTTHGRTGLSHLLAGSVTERVVRTAPCPVLTLRGPRARRPPRRAK